MTTRRSLAASCMLVAAVELVLSTLRSRIPRFGTIDCRSAPRVSLAAYGVAVLMAGVCAVGATALAADDAPAARRPSLPSDWIDCAASRPSSSVVRRAPLRIELGAVLEYRRLFRPTGVRVSGARTVSGLPLGVSAAGDCRHRRDARRLPVARADGCPKWVAANSGRTCNGHWSWSPLAARLARLS